MTIDWGVIQNIAYVFAGAYALKHLCTYLGLRLTTNAMKQNRRM